jgi:hypothetical protein
MYYPHLSSLTPAVVDRIYNIDTASSQAEPTFLILVGAPGSGKSSGHGRAIEAGLIPAGNYATINMDTLLESLLPFRAASSMAHFLKGKAATRDLVRFSTLPLYSSHKEDLGIFNWYDESHAALKEADPATIRAFNRVRKQFAALKGHDTEDRLLDINNAALKRAIDRRIPVVYETTLFLTKEGRVTKIDGLMSYLKKTPYRVVFYHIRGDPVDISRRIQARQEHSTPQNSFPFYRFVPSSVEAVTEYVSTTQKAFNAIKHQYRKRAAFEEIENPYDPVKRPQENRRSTSTRKQQIIRAYGSTDLYVSSPSPSSSPSSSNIFRLSSEPAQQQRRRTTKKSRTED